jgi:NADH dehydrogenase
MSQGQQANRLGRSDRGLVLVVGASGNLGRATIPVLREAGWRVRAMSRTPESLGDLAVDGVDAIRGDLRDRSSLDAACAGVDAVVAAAHAALGNHGSNRPATVDREGNRQLVQAASSAHVLRFVFLSGSGASPDHPIDFFRIKAEAEEFVRNSGLPFVILKPGAFMETWTTFVGMRILEKGRVTLLGDLEKKVNYIAVRDVARFIELALRDDTLLGQTLRLGGPENLSVAELVEIFERAAGRPVKRTQLPDSVARVARLLARPLAPGVHRVLELAMLPPTDDDLFDPAPLLAHYPMTLTRFEQIAQERGSALRGGDRA